MAFGRHKLVDALRKCCGRPNCLDDPAARSVYARDASHLTLGRPLAVVLPGSLDEATDVIKLCGKHGVPFVTRGAGTGLSGGAVPLEGAVVISTARLRQHDPVDLHCRLIQVAAGVVNNMVNSVVHDCGLHFAPDPSSQNASTIGGNIAENAGGPHTLKVGVTLHHVARLQWLDVHGHYWTTGRGLSCERGIDLCSLLIGSEGCLGLVTSADLRLIPVPAAVTTLLAVFPHLDHATRAVVRLMTTGLLPAAVEMVDRAMLEVLEEAFHFGFPTDVDALLIAEFDGDAAAVMEDADRAEELLRQNGAREVRRAEDAAEREQLWRCRKQAFGAVGRLAPSYVTMDVVVPLERLPDIVRAIDTIKQEHGVRIGTGFHAGDGNLHPGIFYDDRVPELKERAHRAADTIIVEALQMGGSISGEHGIGLEKRHVIGDQLDEVAADLMHGIRRLFDPRGLCNPGKALPPRGEHLNEAPPAPQEIDFRWNSLTVTAPADALVAEIQAQALARGLWIPIGAVRFGHEGSGLGAAGTVGELIDHLVAGPSFLGKGTARAYLLEVWAETSNGRLFKAGAPVLKNVAGFDLVHLLCGSGGLLARVQGATFQLKPVPESAALWHCRAEGELPYRADLAALLTELQGWENDLSGPVCVCDRFEVGASGVTILAGGRDRAWDLDRKEQVITRWAEGAGLVLEDKDRCAFSAVARLAEHPALPGWARRSGEWTFLARLPGESGWPIGMGGEQVIWQAAPPLFWVPRVYKETSLGWHADNLLRAGGLTTLPEAAAGVPRHILVGLKEIFDPTGWLGEPDWFEKARKEIR